jgi:hypothetical protein
VAFLALLSLHTVVHTFGARAYAHAILENESISAFSTFSVVRAFQAMESTLVAYSLLGSKSCCWFIKSFGDFTFGVA